jgi:hypothetical protein
MVGWKKGNFREHNIIPWILLAYFLPRKMNKIYANICKKKTLA